MKLYMETISHDRLFKELLTNFFRNLWRNFLRKQAASHKRSVLGGCPVTGIPAAIREQQVAGAEFAVEMDPLRWAINEDDVKRYSGYNNE